ncbi:BREX system ATP-binding domain-containing protein [Streptomyces sp. CC228A]|uniref:BREX system ATP-binding domain-containing protein n=1 Tax=Streptomyces sp. CC228A TaxID=2898186 RepID=UPI001F3C9651|nr:ATP-binding protein [Streptomyces sp. CC228A]
MPRELYGRSEESQIITEMLDSARGGAGAVGLVEGIIGTGKTSLLRWAEETARERGMLALAATATATEQRFPLGVVHQLLSRLPEAADDADAWMRALLPADPDYPLLAGLCACVGRAARRTPLLLTVDGIHHADPQSLLWLGFLGRRLESLPLVLLASKRCGEPASDRHLLVEFMEGVRPDRHIHLHDLSPSAALDLAAALGSRGPGSVDALIAESGGNPYLLTEQIRTGPGPGDPRPGPAGDEAATGLTGRAGLTGRVGRRERAEFTGVTTSPGATGGPGPAGTPRHAGSPGSAGTPGSAGSAAPPGTAAGPGTAPGSAAPPGAAAGPGTAGHPAGASSPYAWGPTDAPPARTRTASTSGCACRRSRSASCACSSASTRTGSARPCRQHPRRARRRRPPR